jgi:type II secretory pathway pseudopilin PulG
MNRNYKYSGFSLIELSILIVVIGLIIGGIMTGGSLIKAVKISRQISQLRDVETAYNLFFLRYKHIPGDMSDATAHWPDSYNGNGDGIYGALEEGFVWSWHNLMKSGLLKGTFTGVYQSYAPFIVPDINVPTAPLGKDTGLYFIYNPVDFYDNFSNFLVVGSSKNGNDFLNGSATTSVIAKTIDRKIDDGIHYTGKVYAFDGLGGGTCVNGRIDYVLSETLDSCKIAYSLGE